MNRKVLFSWLRITIVLAVILGLLTPYQQVRDLMMWIAVLCFDIFIIDTLIIVIKTHWIRYNSPD